MDKIRLALVLSPLHGLPIAEALVTTCGCKDGSRYLFIGKCSCCLFSLLLNVQDEERPVKTMPTPALPEPAHPELDSMLTRKFGKEVANYFAGNDCLLL